MTLVIIGGGIDLSVGPTAAMSAVLAAALMAAGVPIALAIPAAILFGAAAGAMNGMLVAFGGLQPFIVTLGTLSLYRACALINRGNPIFGIPPAFESLQLVGVRHSEPGGDRRGAGARRLDRPQ